MIAGNRKDRSPAIHPTNHDKRRPILVFPCRLKAGQRLINFVFTLLPSAYLVFFITTPL